MKWKKLSILTSNINALTTRGSASTLIVAYLHVTCLTYYNLKHSLFFVEYPSL